LLVSSNVIASNGVFSLYSVETKITNSTFRGNTANSPAAEGGAIYIACTSPCNKELSLKTVILSSLLENNVVRDGGLGGAVYVTNYPGTVSIENSTFLSNQAVNGGAISVELSSVNISNSLFQDNIAIEGGGGIFWIYSSTFPTSVDTLTSLKSENNHASYGSFIATDLVYLNSSFPSFVSYQVSGKQLTTPMNVSLLDFYGQVVTNSSLYTAADITVYANIYGDSGVLKGSSTVASVNGIASFEQVVLTGVPGGNTTVTFSVPLSQIENINQIVLYRECESGEITQPAGNNLYSCEKCGLGTYSFYPSDTQCNVCPQHASCPGGNQLILESGYWRVDQTSASVLACAQPSVCDGGNDTSTQCAYGSTGPYCSVCIDGYTPSRSGDCYPCDNSSDTASQLVSTILFVAVIIVVYILFKYKKKIMKVYSKAVKKAIKNRKFRTLRVKLKIIIAFIQIIYQLGPALNIVFPVLFISYLNYYALFQLNFLLIPNVTCIVQTNYYSSLVVSTISPFIFFVVIACVIQFLALRAKRLNEKNPSYSRSQANKDTITAAFIISYFVLVNVSTTILRVFQCETFDDGSSYLVADYSIDCNAADRSFYVAYGSVMLLIYPIGIPLVYSFVLFYYRKLINPDWRKVIDTNEKVFVANRVIQQEKIKVRNTYREIDNIRNLFDSFTPKRWYFEIFDCERRLCLGAIPGN
jgi:hypothetical protein